MAQHKKSPTHKFILEIGTRKKRVVSSKLAHQVVQQEFPDVTMPGEMSPHTGVLRFLSPTQGWIYVTWEDVDG